MEKLVTIEVAAEMLGTSEDWLYRNAKKLPFAVKISRKQLRFSLKGMTEWIEEKQNGSREHIQKGRELVD